MTDGWICRAEGQHNIRHVRNLEIFQLQRYRQHWSYPEILASGSFESVLAASRLFLKMTPVEEREIRLIHFNQGPI
jgi:hypothetical protein